MTKKVIKYNERLKICERIVNYLTFTPLQFLAICVLMEPWKPCVPLF